MFDIQGVGLGWGVCFEFFMCFWICWMCLVVFLICFIMIGISCDVCKGEFVSDYEKVSF